MSRKYGLVLAFLLVFLLLFSSLGFASSARGSGDAGNNQKLDCQSSDSCYEIDLVWSKLITLIGFSAIGYSNDKYWTSYGGGSGEWVAFTEKYSEYQENEDSITVRYGSSNVEDLAVLMSDLSDGKYQISTTHSGQEYCVCGDHCEDYAKSVIQYSEEYSVDPLLVVSMMMKESSCKQSVGESSAGCVGTTQICSYQSCVTSGPKISALSDLEGEENYDSNIHCGVYLLKKKYDGGQNDYPDGRLFTCINETYTDWELALRYYNGWIGESMCNTENNKNQWYYVESVMEIYGQLKEISS